MFIHRFGLTATLTEHARQRMTQRWISVVEICQLLEEDTIRMKNDILVMDLAEKPVVKEISKDWSTHINYAEDGTVVEVVVLEASQQGAWLFQHTAQQ